MSFLSIYRVCNVNGVALVGGFSCPANFTDNSTTACSEENPELQRIFMSVTISSINTSVYDPDNNPPWIEGFEPTCAIGIPGITRTRTIVGRCIIVGVVSQWVWLYIY